MNLRALGLTASLVANGLLLVAVARLSHSAGLTRSSAPDPNAANSLPSAPAVAASPTAPTAVSWSALASGSLPEVVSRLQAEGFPPRLQRIIVRALVAEQFADRHRELANLIRARPWWTTFTSEEGVKLITARQKLQREESDVVDALLGPDLGSSEYITGSRHYRYGDLPPATLAQLDRINADYGELSQEIQLRAQGMMLPEDREKLLFLQRQAHADIAPLLTPAQLLEYDMRSSSLGWWLRNQLSAMNATEEEFRAIYQVQSALWAPYADGNYQLMSAAQRQALTQLEPQLKEQIRAVLPPDRYAEYEQKTNPVYVQTDAVVKRLNLAPETTATVVAVQNEISQRAAALRSNAALAPAARNAQLNALAEEAVTRLTPAFGNAGLSAYRESPAGRWLSALRPPSSPPSAPPKG